MAECHPVGFQWVVEAKERGARVIHVDPRFTRTSALAELHVPIRAGSDIAFLGGIVNHILENDRWFPEYVTAYTNAATIIDERFADTEDLDGLFSGWDPSAAPMTRRAGSTRAWEPPRRPARRRRAHRSESALMALTAGSSNGSRLRRIRRFSTRVASSSC